ncbi:hypothetical protein T05_9326 [Trichinella murrelli]|uniref:Uncharacterized protein n=1 Tax=Trichinella murrelli TaxID=144512 RepID=A0A0V0UD88_9BILA|nr:hypothetical protein T05_9326 [Trichinella murrelli]
MRASTAIGIDLLYVYAFFFKKAPIFQICYLVQVLSPILLQLRTFGILACQCSSICCLAECKDIF